MATDKPQEEFERLFQKAMVASKVETDPALRKHIETTYRKNRKAGLDTADAWNKVLEDLTGPFSRDREGHLAPRRTAIGNVLRGKRRASIDREIGKKSGKAGTWEVRSLDVWGNAKDGFEVNQSYRSGKIKIPEGATDRDVLKIMRDEGHLSEKSKGIVKIENTGDGTTIDIVDRKNGKPVFQLVQEED